MMQDAEASRSRTYLPLENKKQNTFAFEITSNPRGFLESTRRKGLEFTRKLKKINKSLNFID